ncbi:hypothetical protein AS594_39060 [Streptomyces agglomeratus]|uniref:Integral membrane protein n=1 Tax=Streptomyces agglomeratus TaxID=285458 RepID=A0A1E5NZD4_9ACTN|nr:hypothetical protein [Streptomyces agglomeratus]OEJ21541.1 hypothetical protein AS594_39060 [Streptomyces agglomeratus]
MTRPSTWRLWLRILGSARLRLALLVAALAATAFTLLTSLPAHAEPTPTPSPSVPTAPGQRTPTPEEIEAIEEVMREQSERLSKAAQQELLEQEKERLRKLLPDEGGVLGVFNVTDSNGLPISVYTVKSDTGGLLDWDLGIQNLLTELCFMVTKWLIAFCCWLIAWALSFGLAKLLLAPVLSVANSLHTRVILEMGLPTLFLSVCAIICVARIFFGDKAKGWGDAALSILLAALTTTLLSSTPQTLLGEEDGAIAVTRGLALEVADIILDANPATPQSDNGVTTEATGNTLSRPLTDALTDAFIVKPAMLLQYGRVFEGKCAAEYADTRLEQLAFDRQVHSRTNKLKDLTGLSEYIDPSGGGIAGWYNTQIDMSTRWAIDHFGDPPMEAFEAKCVPGDVGAAKKASMDKVGGAFFLLIAAGIVTVIVSGLAGSFLVAQCRIAWDAIRGEPALIAGTIPGAGRAFLWDWAASVLRSLGQMLTSVIALAVFIIIIQAVLDPAQEDWGRELTLRFLVVDLVCIGALKKRKELAAGSKQTAANFRGKLSAGRVGGTHGSAFSPPASSTVPKNRHIGRTTARGIVRGALVGVSLAHGNPLAAVGYAMPQAVGATALMSRINTGGRGGRRRPPARRPAGHQAHRAGYQSQMQRPVPSRPTQPPPSPPAPIPTPRPRTQPRPSAGPNGRRNRRLRAMDATTRRHQQGRQAQPTGNAPRPGPVQSAGQRSTSRTRPARTQPNSSRRNQPAQQPPLNEQPHRGAQGPGGFAAWLDSREAQALARRRTPPRSSS